MPPRAHASPTTAYRMCAKNSSSRGEKSCSRCTAVWMLAPRAASCADTASSLASPEETDTVISPTPPSNPTVWMS